MALCELPSNRCRTFIDEIAKDEGFKQYKLLVSQPLKPGENYFGQIFKVIITEDDTNDASKSISLILKVSLKLEKLRLDNFIQDFYQREAYVYTTILPILDELQKDLSEDERFTFAKFYKATLEEGDEMLVLEDMGERNYRMLDRMIIFDYDQLVACIKHIARFHATSFVMRAKRPKAYQDIYNSTYNYQRLKDDFGMFIKLNTPSALQLIENEPYQEAIQKVVDHVWEYYMDLFESDVDDEYSVLIHGDAWNNNLLFHDEDGKTDKMVFVDWQQMRNASPIIDISYILMLSIDSQMRSKHYNEMLDLYYGVLSANVTKMEVDISECYPPSVFRSQVDRYMKFGLVAGFAMLPLNLTTPKERLEVFDSIDGKNDQSRIPLSKISRARMKELFADCFELKII